MIFSKSSHSNKLTATQNMVKFYSLFFEFFHILFLALMCDKRIKFVYILISFARIIFTLKTIFYISML